MTSYQFTTLPGLAPVLVEEIHERLGVTARPMGATRLYDFTSLQFSGEMSRLHDLRISEDVFLSLGRLKLSGRPNDVKSFEAAAWSGAPLKAALGQWAQFRGQPLTKRLTWRVVAQAEDATWRQYRRNELTLAAERALLRAGSSWRINREVAPLELWLQQVGHELLVSLRLTTPQDRQHGGREIERAAALRPSVAAAMVRLTQPTANDVFLDPMCGSGTLLLERAVAERYQLLLGGDNDPAAVEATLANFGPRHQPRKIERWDARKLPFEDGSITAIGCNLPWGRQIGEQTAMPALYGAVIPEFARVLASGGRAVLLTSEWAALKRALQAEPRLRLERTIQNVGILGRRADIVVLVRDKPRTS